VRFATLICGDAQGVVFNCDELVEVVYESGRGCSSEMERERLSGYPSTVIRAGRLFRLVRSEIVAKSGGRTYLRVRYRHQNTPKPPGLGASHLGT
jgi:hypothetical protein